MLQTLEEQVAGERQRLVETHLARVEAILNNNRRLALENYLTAVQSDPPQVSPSRRGGGSDIKKKFKHLLSHWLWPLFNFFFQPERVLQALKRYMAAEQKDRRHTLRHYQHIVAVDPQKAEQMKFQVCEISATRNAFRARLCFWYARSPFSADRETYGTLCAEELGLNSQRWSSSQSSFHYTEIKARLCWLQKLPFDTWIHEKYLSGLSFFIHLRNHFTASLLTAKTTSTHTLFDIVGTLKRPEFKTLWLDSLVDMPNIRSNMDLIHFIFTGHLLYEDNGYILFLSCMRPKYDLISPNMRSLTLVIREYHCGYRHTWVASWNNQTVIT